MSEQDIRQQAIDLYDRFTHESLDRRVFMARMTALAGSVAAAEALVATIAASPASAAIVPPDDKRLATSIGPLGFDSPLSGYVAATRGTAKRGVVLVIHENRGLNAHIEDVARRIALAGFIAVAPDELSPFGGTPTDEDKARELIGKVPLAKAVADTVALGSALKTGLNHSNGKLGIIGFCWGGAFVNRFAVAAGDTLDAGVSYYGPAPAPEEAARVKAPLLLHYAGLDTRVAKTGEPWVKALKAAGKPVESYVYPGVNHAFNNDTSAERYDKPAADLAWGRTIAFLKERLG